MTITLIHLIASVALLLWATRFVTASITSVFGGNVRAILSSSTSNRFKAFATGFGITALLQSSSATALMTLSFVKSASISLTAAIAVILGADLSTTIIAQILIFDLSLLSPALIIIGSMTLSSEAPKRKAIGNALIGLGLILLSLTMIREVVAPLKDSTLLIQILESLQGEPILAILFSAILTWLMHSSLATILFYTALISKDIIGLDLGILFVLGANIGSACIPYIATYSQGAAVRRLTSLNLLMRGIIVALTIPFLTPIAAALQDLTTDSARQIVITHTGLNIALVLIFLPFTQKLATLGYNLIKDTHKDRAASSAHHLDESALDKPTIALAGATRETLRMADFVESMTIKAFEALQTNNQGLLKEAKDTDNQLDDVFQSTKIYLTRLKHDTLTQAETAQMEKIMAFATNLEHAGDLIQHSMSDTIQKKIEARENFSPEGWLEIKEFYNAVIDNIQTAQSVFISHCSQLAGEMIENKKHLKQREFQSRRKHFNRLSEKQPQSLATSTIHIDLMRDLGRINSYVTSVAYETLNTPKAG